MADVGPRTEVDPVGGRQYGGIRCFSKAASKRATWCFATSSGSRI